MPSARCDVLQQARPTAGRAPTLCRYAIAVKYAYQAAGLVNICGPRRLVKYVDSFGTAWQAVDNISVS